MGDLIKSLFPEDKSKEGMKITKKQRKYIMGLLALVAIGILIMSFADYGSDNSEGPPLVFEATRTDSGLNFTSNLVQAEQFMEERLEHIIGQIQGVGKVAVQITLDSSMEFQYAVNTKTDQTTINEQAQDGSTRTTNETREDAQVVMKSMTQGKNEPVIVKEVRPQVTGVMVVAEGAEDILLREKISQSVQTVLNIPAHRVTVLPKGK